MEVIGITDYLLNIFAIVCRYFLGANNFIRNCNPNDCAYVIG